MKNKKILIVDDSATMRMFLSMTIKKAAAGISLTEAVNGVDAVEKLKKDNFDLVLTDINMPEMDGTHLVEKIRGQLNKNMPIIIEALAKVSKIPSPLAGRGPRKVADFLGCR